eukprot:GHVR01133753.1.p2 GENE.GHVR01133753.1~~GHVR01133753.1.p2  ORF type:complete len:150 (-),score=58.07 GHVR01133753.1:315-764(-)
MTSMSYDCSVDLYAVGACVFFMFTGREPPRPPPVQYTITQPLCTCTYDECTHKASRNHSFEESCSVCVCGEGVCSMGVCVPGMGQCVPVNSEETDEAERQHACDISSSLKGVCVSKEGIEFVTQCMSLLPQKRSSAKVLLKHKWFEGGP